MDKHPSMQNYKEGSMTPVARPQSQITTMIMFHLIEFRNTNIRYTEGSNEDVTHVSNEKVAFESSTNLQIVPTPMATTNSSLQVSKIPPSIFYNDSLALDSHLQRGRTQVRFKIIQSFSIGKLYGGNLESFCSCRGNQLFSLLILRMVLLIQGVVVKVVYLPVLFICTTSNLKKNRRF